MRICSDLSHLGTLQLLKYGSMLLMVIAISAASVRITWASEVDEPAETSEGEVIQDPVTDPDLSGLQTDVFNTWSQAVDANKGIQDLKDTVSSQDEKLSQIEEKVSSIEDSATKDDLEGVENGLQEIKQDTGNILSLLNSSNDSESDSEDPPKTLDDVYNLLYVLINSVWMGLGVITGLYIMRCAFV